MGTTDQNDSRRTLKFNTLDDLLNDALALQAKGVTTHGKWTAAQVFLHVSAVIQASIEGFTFKMPFPVRIVGRLIRNRSLSKGFPSGIKIPSSAKHAFDPPANISLDEAMRHLIGSVNKAKQKQMQQVSPIFGALNHDQWVELHCRHAELHFSYLSAISQPHDTSHTKHNANHLRHASATA